MGEEGESTTAIIIYNIMNITQISKVKGSI